MSAPRFYVPPGTVALAADCEVALPVEVARHAMQVLRLRDGAPIVLFDGTGGEYPATLAAAGRGAVARTLAHVAVEREAPAAITLVQALVASDVMDGIVRKAVELGVARIVPVLAERSQRGPAERLERRVARWAQIAVAACEQCGRNRVPGIEDARPLRAWVEAARDVRGAALLDPRAARSLAAAAADTRMVIIGPEGGFTQDEAALCTGAGAHAVHLGARTLRADTAALAALATLQATIGDARER
jgi:16S rRNA (uracil1498-N3)-methyltransferase